MAYKEETKNPDASTYEYEFKADYESDWSVHRNYINSFDAYEAMLLGTVYDSVSSSVDTSKITDSYAMTLAKERADRVIAKHPEGTTQSVGRADVGKAAFMDILRQKWIYPNANAQRPYLEKLNLWQLYSSVYGYMPMFYDWTTSNTGYVGPDCWLWNPRNLVPQQGKVSIEDMDYVTALTWVSKKKLEDILDKAADGDGWDEGALRELIDKVSDKNSGNDANQDTLVERDRAPGGTKKGICLATRYEAGEDGKWCTFAPDNGYVKVRELDNPHKNGRIPFVIKYSQPLFDSFYGLGDFQRAKPLQFARDGLTNFYFANLKRNLAPGIIVNANGVVKHTLDVTKPNPVLMETIKDSIRPMPTNTAGLSTYQGAMQNLTGSLLSLYGTQNASIPGAEALNPSQGKTPAAIENYTQKEATRDGAERRHLEAAIEQLTDGFFSLVVNIGTEDVPVSLFSDDIQDIVDAGLDDVVNLFEGGKFKPDATMTAGDLSINPETLKGVEYRFNVDTDSTMKINKDQQLQSVTNLLGDLGKFQNIYKDDPRVDVNFGEILQRIGELSGIKGADKFITVKDGPTPQEQQMQQKMQELQAQNQQQSQTQIQTPGGQVHESADLVKMFVAVEDIGVKNAILQLMGLPPITQVAQPIANAGGVFSDPHVAAAAEHIAGLTTNPPAAPPTPTVNAGGSFHDPHLADVAATIDTMGRKSPPPMKEPVGGTSGAK
jgi:hypothetical protein